MKGSDFLAAAALIAFSDPAWAQAMDHSKMPGMQVPANSATATAPAIDPACPPEHAAMGHCKPKAPPPPPPPPPPARPMVDPACLPEHAAMGHCTPKASSPPPPKTDPACLPEHAAMGHCVPKAALPLPTPSAAGSDPHAAHDMGRAEAAAPAGTDLPAGAGAAPPVPTDHAADAVYGSPAMAMGRHHLKAFHGDQKLFQAMFNLAEVQVRNGRDGFEWDAEAWYGGDIGRLWLKSEGEGEFGRELEKAEVQALYSHAIGPYFNLQGGLRYDFKPNPSRVYATIGVEGLAPSFFDVEAALFLSDKGELMARAEGYYDQRITQRLILQPRAELNFAAQNSPDIQVGAGLSDAEIGLRLRYDIRREFAPYVGVQYRRAFGRTRDYLKAAGEDTGGWSLLAGIRAWF